MHAKRWQIQGGSNLQNCIYKHNDGDNPKFRKESLNKPQQLHDCIETEIEMKLDEESVKLIRVCWLCLLPEPTHGKKDTLVTDSTKGLIFLGHRGRGPSRLQTLEFLPFVSL